MRPARSWPAPRRARDQIATVDRWVTSSSSTDFRLARALTEDPTEDDVSSLGFTDVVERRPFWLLARCLNGQECVTGSGRPPRIAGHACVEVDVPPVSDGLTLLAPRSNERSNAPRRDHMASRSAEESSPFASVDRFRFDEDGWCRLDGRLFDGLGASPYFVTCREHLKRRGSVLAIIEVDVKCLPEIAPLDEGCSWTSPIDIPTLPTETIPGYPRCSARFRSA